MRMRCWAAAAVALAAVLSPGRATAQKMTEPTVEIRLRSVNDLLDRGEYIAGLVGQEEPVKQVRGLITQLSGEGKGIEGIDPKRPFGAYAVITPDVQDSPVVLMVPIADKDRLLTALKERLGITPEKEGDALKVHVPLLPVPLYLAFANNYVYVSHQPKALDPKQLIDAKAYFAKDDGAVASAVARLDRVPDQLKGFVSSQFELFLNQERKKGPAGNPAEAKLKEFLFDAAAGGAKSLVDDAKEASIKVFIDPKSDDLSIEASLSAKDGSTLARNIAGLAAQTSLPAGIVAAAGTPVGKGNVKIGLTPELKKRWEVTVDALIEQGIKDAGDRAASQKVFDAIAPTVKAGEFDAAAALTGPDVKGRYGLVVAAAVKDGGGMLKVLKEFAGFIPGDAAEVTFDAEKVGKFTLHKAELKFLDEKVEKVFGTKTVWLATSDDCIVASVEADGAAIRKALTAKPAPVSVFSGDLAAAKLIPLVGQNLKPDEIKAMLKDAFGDGSSAGKDTVTISVTGGNRLTAKVQAKGKVLRLMSSFDQFKIR
jgi:hypothetical protein